jgi:hypothetical protein
LSSKKETKQGKAQLKLLLSTFETAACTPKFQNDYVAVAGGEET